MVKMTKARNKLVHPPPNLIPSSFLHNAGDAVVKRGAAQHTQKPSRVACCPFLTDSRDRSVHGRRRGPDRFQDGPRGVRRGEDGYDYW